MVTQSDQDSAERIRELESRVAELTREVDALRAERRARAQTGRRAGDPKPPPPPIRRKLWLARGLLLLMMSALILAATLVVRRELRDFDYSQDWLRQLASANMDYRILGLAILAGLAFMAYLTRRYFLFMFLGLACSYATYAMHLSGTPIATAVSEGVQFWGGTIFLVCCYVLASWLCVYESLRLGKARRRAVLVSLLNTLTFLPLMWAGLYRHAPETAWLVFALLAVLAGFFAVLAESIGSYRNYMFQLHTATAILLINIALQSLLTEEGMLIALALECLVLAAIYHLSGIVVLKLLNLIALLVTLALALRATKLGMPVDLAGMPVRANWAYGLSTCGLLLVAAYYYGRHIRALDPQQRRLSGHWFLADTAWDVSCTTVGLLHSAASALILMVLTIADFGDKPSLPYLLALESVGLAILGVIVRTPQMEISAVMLIVACHVSYYFFLSIGKREFSDQPHFVPYTLLVVGYTYFGAHRWQKYLRSLQQGHPWEHYFSVSLPYLVATGMLMTLMQLRLAPVPLPMTQAAFGLAVVVLGAFLADAAVKTAGVAALLVGAYVFLSSNEAWSPHPAVSDTQGWGASLLLLFLFIAERVLFLGRNVERERARAERFGRSLLVAVAVAVGFLGLRVSVPGDSLPLAWVGFACGFTVLGTILRENRYRWAAAAVIGAALAWCFGYERASLYDAVSKTLLAGAVAASLLLMVSWGIAVRRSHAPRKAPPPPVQGSAPHG